MQTAKNDVINVHSHFQGKFNTHTGRVIDLKNPSPQMIEIEDIATSLSRICRFGGHSSAFYSVAQHSVMVAAYAPIHAKKWALMHDAAEAYLGDVIKPLKVMLEPQYKQIEEAFERCINIRFSVEPTEWIKASVKLCDKHLLEVEHEALILGNPRRFNELLYDVGWHAPENGKWAWDHETAKSIFLATFNEMFL
jgi:hypothetical protein